MKHKVIQKEKEFEPVTIEITFETRDELIEIWKRLNLGCIYVDRQNTNYYDHKCDNNRTFRLWKSLDNILEHRRAG